MGFPMVNQLFWQEHHEFFRRRCSRCVRLRPQRWSGVLRSDRQGVGGSEIGGRVVALSRWNMGLEHGAKILSCGYSNVIGTTLMFDGNHTSHKNWWWWLWMVQMTLRHTHIRKYSTVLDHFLLNNSAGVRQLSQPLQLCWAWCSTASAGLSENWDLHRFSWWFHGVE